MDCDPYVVRRVSRMEYEKCLKPMKDEILSTARSSLNSFWQQRSGHVDMDFMYNPDYMCVGVFVRRGSEPRLVSNNTDFGEEERQLAYELRAEIKNRLDFFRLEKGNWI